MYACACACACVVKDEQKQEIWSEWKSQTDVELK